MTGPGDENAAGSGRGHLRASHADREQVIDTLKAAFVQGRLTKEEFDLRVSQTFASRTYADIAARTADLPDGPTRIGPPADPAPAQGQPPVSNVLKWGACVVLVGAAGSILAGLSTNTFLLLVAGVLGVLIAAPVAGTLMLDSWHEKRPRGQLPPRPARDGRPSEDEHDGGTGQGLILSEARQDTRSRPAPVIAVAGAPGGH